MTRKSVKASPKPATSVKLTDELHELTYESHGLVNVSCEFQISDRCRKSWEAEYKEIVRTKKKNNGKVICVFCSRKLKYSGSNNRNCKTLDDRFLDVIDTEEKAYLLGWIASNCSVVDNNVISISVKSNEKYILEILGSLVCDELSVIDNNTCVSSLRICSTNIADRACKHLHILQGKKSHVVRFPEAIPDQLKWCFIRGLFDGDGSIADLTYSTCPTCKIASYSANMKIAIKEFCNIPCSISDSSIEFFDTNALDFLGKIYDKCGEGLYLSRKRLLFWDWACWVPTLMQKGALGKEVVFKWFKICNDAIPPFKERITDSGWDLTLIREVKRFGDTIMYGTGLKIIPDFGWCFDLCARSNMIKTGHMLTNSVGIIDRGYRGEILAVMTKFDKTMPDLKLPARIVQIIPRPAFHFEFVEVDNLDETYRNEGGFGSTN